MSKQACRVTVAPQQGKGWQKAGHTATCSGVSRSWHRSTRDSASRRPCPSSAAAAPSKPYSCPKLSHATTTPSVESISVLEEINSRISGQISRVQHHLSPYPSISKRICEYTPCKKCVSNLKVITTWLDVTHCINGDRRHLVRCSWDQEPDRCVFKLQVFLWSASAICRLIRACPFVVIEEAVEEELMYDVSRCVLPSYNLHACFNPSESLPEEGRLPSGCFDGHSELSGHQASGTYFLSPLRLAE